MSQLTKGQEGGLEFDVVVAGGGITGCCAAIAAARHGARTALVELSGYLGGVAACVSKFPWNAFYNYQEKRLAVRGIPLEIAERLQDWEGASTHHLDPVMESLTDINSAMLRLELAQMMEEEGVAVFFHSMAVEPLVEAGEVRGIYIQTRGGRKLLRCRVLVDAEDCADMAVKAGVDYEYGWGKDEKTQIASGVLTLGNVNMNELIGAIEKDPRKVRPREFTEEELDYVIRSLRDSPLSCIGCFGEELAKAKAEGLDLPDREIVSGTIYPRTGQLISVASKVKDVRPMDVENISRAELAAYRQMKVLYQFFRKYVPGCEHAVLQSVSTQIGVRETLHIKGEYTLCAQDLIEGTIFQDAVAAGSYIMDIHSPDHGGVDPCTELPTYTIPYRSLVPQKVDGLLVAGRCISATHEAMSSFRVIPIVAAMGEGAGTAAALCALRGCKPRDLDPALLRETLIAANCEVGQNFQQVKEK